jgi:hypothetical protein
VAVVCHRYALFSPVIREPGKQHGEHPMNKPTMNNPANPESVVARAQATGGRLVFARGATGVTLHADPTLPQLYHAHFAHHVPLVEVHDSTVIVHYRHVPLVGWLVNAAHEPLAAITLNGSLPWEIEFRGGVRKLEADLRKLQLRALDVLGGASHITLTLPAPSGTVFVHIAGGVSNCIIHRPTGVALRMEVSGGVSDLSFDERYIGEAGATGRWESANYSNAGDRFDISIGGGASNITIVQREGE